MVVVVLMVRVMEEVAVVAAADVEAVVALVAVS